MIPSASGCVVFMTNLSSCPMTKDFFLHEHNFVVLYEIETKGKGGLLIIMLVIMEETRETSHLCTTLISHGRFRALPHL